jgi:hypothetical protein
LGTQRSVLKLRDAGMVVDDAPQLQVYRPISGQRIADVVSNFIAHPPLKLRKSSIAKYRNALSSFTVNILAAVAEHEASMISARTKAALAAAKARGVVSGGNAAAWTECGPWQGRATQPVQRSEGLPQQSGTKTFCQSSPIYVGLAGLLHDR